MEPQHPKRVLQVTIATQPETLIPQTVNFALQVIIVILLVWLLQLEPAVLATTVQLVSLKEVHQHIYAHRDINVRPEVQKKWPAHLESIKTCLNRQHVKLVQLVISVMVQSRIQQSVHMEFRILNHVQPGIIVLVEPKLLQNILVQMEPSILTLIKSRSLTAHLARLVHTVQQMVCLLPQGSVPQDITV